MCINGSFSRIRSAWAESAGEVDMAAFDAIDNGGYGIELTSTVSEVDYVRGLMAQIRRRGIQECDKEKKKKSDASYYQRNRDKIRERTRKYYLEHRDTECARRRQYYQEHIEQEHERMKTRYLAKKHEKGMENQAICP